MSENFYRRVERVQNETGKPVEVTEEEYWDALEVLPPIYLNRGRTSAFAVSEAHSHNAWGEPVYHCFSAINGKFYGFVGTISDARVAFDRFRYTVESVREEGTVAEFEQAVERGETISLLGLSKAIQREKGR